MRNNRTLYDVFLGYLIKKGNKIKAKKILDTTFLNLVQKTNLSLNSILKKILLKMGNIVEIRTVKRRRNTYIVPFAVNRSRRNYILVKKIMDSVKEDLTKRPLSKKLTDEMIRIIKGKSSKSLIKNKKAVKLAITNRSNTHFRW
jgi:ribosomal protein S7